MFILPSPLIITGVSPGSSTRGRTAIAEQKWSDVQDIGEDERITLYLTRLSMSDQG